MDYAKEIRTLINTGKYVIGQRKAIRHISDGNAKAVLVSSNMPQLVFARFNNYAKLSGMRIIKVPFTSAELGSVCGKAHLISSIVVFDQGDSKVLKS